MTSTFHIVTEAPVAPQALFDISLDIDQHVASMASSGEEAIAGTVGGPIGLHDTVTWRARHFGIWFTMTSTITVLDRPDRFVDEQVSGPFRKFIHEHRFESTADGCRMTDTVTLASPIFGRLVERMVLVPYLRRLLAIRNAHLIAAVARER